MWTWGNDCTEQYGAMCDSCRDIIANYIVRKINRNGGSASYIAVEKIAKATGQEPIIVLFDNNGHSKECAHVGDKIVMESTGSFKVVAA
jgi:hypothetical protein